MTELTKENFNATVDQFDKILLFAYKENHGASFIGLSLIEEIDRLVGKDFQICLVNVDTEPEISNLLSISDPPEYICIKNSKIHKRAIQLNYSNHILDLLK